MVYERQAIVSIIPVQIGAVSRHLWYPMVPILDVRLAVGRQATISSTLEGNQPKHGHHIYHKFLPPYY